MVLSNVQYFWFKKSPLTVNWSDNWKTYVQSQQKTACHFHKYNYITEANFSTFSFPAESEKT